MNQRNRQKNICLLGATGSIGQSTVDVVRQHPDRFRIFSAAIYSNWKKMIPILEEFDIQMLAIWDEAACKAFVENYSGSSNLKVVTGMDGLLELVSGKDVEYVVNGLVGAIGCEPTLRAIENKKHVGLANKETMVMAGNIINQALKDNPGSALVPIDSEHSAIFQCLAGRPPHEVESIILTASGGPFRTLPAEEFSSITVEKALKHPTWDMGPKITIDSATMMNKGLEVIEAHYLFDVDIPKIQIVVHPTSTVHSFVQFRDGSLMAQLGSPDMKLPILYALTFPERLDLNIERLDIAKQGKLEFFPPDLEKFRCIALAYKAAELGGTAPAVINAANEVVVEMFLQEKIQFAQIPQIIENVLEESSLIENPDISQVLAADEWARKCARELARGEGIKSA